MLFRLVALSGGRVDAALAAVERVILTRRDGAAYAEIDETAAGAFVRSLAYAGVRAEPCPALPTVTAATLAARGVDLEPLPVGTLALDVVRLDRVALGHVTREVLRPRLLGLLGPSERARDRCREIIRGGHATFEWSRTAWAARAALRAGRARRSLRPILFSHETPGRSAGRVTTEGSAVGRWLFG